MIPEVTKIARNSLVLGALTIVAASWGAAASAVPASATVPQIAVHYADLDLTSRDGARAFHRRIVAAARTVCFVANNRDLKLSIMERECQMRAIEQALRASGKKELAAVYAVGQQRS